MNAKVDNFERMIQLANEFFQMKDDPSQISVDEAVVQHLKAIHPRTMSERRDEHGPHAWILLIPTTRAVMNDFLKGTINERELLEKTNPGLKYEAIYLCSALVLPEMRGKGYAKELTIEAIKAIRKDHPITDLYVWSFSEEGDALASLIARLCDLPLHKKESCLRQGNV
jgi:predicted GNAT family acetyltransferase